MLDEELVARAQMGQKEALTEICNRYAPLIGKYAKQWRNAFGGYEDAKSTATLAFIELVHQYDETRERFFRGWIDLAVSHALSKLHRFSKAAKRTATLVHLEAPVTHREAGEALTYEDILDDPHLFTHVDRVADRIDVEMVVQEFLQKAPEYQVEMFALTILRDYEVKEVAAAMELQRKTAEARRATMVKHLQKIAIKHGLIDEMPIPKKGRPRRGA